MAGVADSPTKACASCAGKRCGSPARSSSRRTAGPARFRSPCLIQPRRGLRFCADCVPFASFGPIHFPKRFCMTSSKSRVGRAAPGTGSRGSSWSFGIAACWRDWPRLMAPTPATWRPPATPGDRRRLGSGPHAGWRSGPNRSKRWPGSGQAMRGFLSLRWLRTHRGDVGRLGSAGPRTADPTRSAPLPRRTSP